MEDHWNPTEYDICHVGYRSWVLVLNGGSHVHGILMVFQWYFMVSL